jgi:hypothetical protein
MAIIDDKQALNNKQSLISFQRIKYFVKKLLHLAKFEIMVQLRILQLELKY